MATQLLPTLLRQIRTLAGPLGDESTDAQLLDRFVMLREEAAFTALVERHGSMVFGVARRTLRDRQEAEDVFQATFLVLARKAASIRKQGSVASWLYGVARRIALRARNRPVASEEMSAIAAVGPGPEGDAAWRELRPVLDEELARLPEKYRAPLVLCYLEHRSNEEAARELGWPSGTVKGRLARAREVLRQRLTRRGLALAAVALGASVGDANAMLPATVLGGVASYALGRAAPGEVSARALTLAADGGVRLFAARVALVVLFLLTAFGTAGIHGVGPLAADTKAPEEAPALPAPAPPAAPVAAAPPKLLDRFGDPLPPGALLRMGTIRFSHGDSERLEVIVAPNSKAILSYGFGPTPARLWDAETGKELWSIAPRGMGWAAAFSPDGKTIALHARMGRTGLLVDTATGRVLQDLTLPAIANGDGRTCFTGDGTAAVFWANDAAFSPQLYDVATGNKIHTVAPNQSVITAVAPALDGTRLLTGDDEGRIQFWDSETGRGNHLLLQIAKEEDAGLGQNPDRSAQVVSLAYAPKGKRLAGASYDGRICIWDPLTGKETHCLRRTGDGPRRSFPDTVLFFGPNPDLLGFADSSGVYLWDLGEKEATWIAKGRSGAFLSDGTTLVVAGPTGAIRLFDTISGREIRQRFGHQATVQSLAYSPDGKMLLGTDADRIAPGNVQVLRIWDAATSRELQTIKRPAERWDAEHPPLPPRFGSDGKTVLFDGKNANQPAVLARWDTTVGRLHPVLPLPRYESIIALAADQTAITANMQSDSLARWDLKTGARISQVKIEQMQRWGQGEFTPEDIRYSPDGDTFVSGCNDRQGVVQLHDATTGKIIAVLVEKTRDRVECAYSPGGELLAIRDERGDTKDKFGFQVWNVADRKHLYSLKGNPRPRITTWGFSADGQTLALMDFKGGLRLWDAPTGQELFTLPGAQAIGGRLTVDRSGRTLAAGSEGGLIRVWDLPSGQLIGTFQGDRHSGRVAPQLVFAPDGKTLASSDGPTILVWDISGLQRPQAEAAPKQADLPALWDDLASEDGGKAWRAAYALGLAPELAVPFLRDHLRGIDAPAQRLATLIGELDHDEFAIRENAMEALRKLGSDIRPALEAALVKPASAEQQRRIEQVLESLDNWSPARRRQGRSLAVLSRMQSPAGRKLLEDLAQGPDWLSKQARLRLAP